jgi:hypothetical protein
MKHAFAWDALLLAAALGAGGVCAQEPAQDPDQAQPQVQEPRRNETPAEQAAEQSWGIGSPSTSGGTTTAPGAGRVSPGLAVDEGTVMRPLSAQGTNRAGTETPPRRKQLYGLNPKADDPDASRATPAAH